MEREEFERTRMLTIDFVEHIFYVGQLWPNRHFQELYDDYLTQLKRLLRIYASKFVEYTPGEPLNRLLKVFGIWQMLLERTVRRTIEDQEDKGIVLGPVAHAAIQRLGQQIRQLFITISKKAANMLIYGLYDD